MRRPSSPAAPPGGADSSALRPHDVQAKVIRRWNSPPFEPRRDGRLYREVPPTTRPVSPHLAALSIPGDELPVGGDGVRRGRGGVGFAVVELAAGRPQDELAADVIVIADLTLERRGARPDRSLRRLADCVVEVATLDHSCIRDRGEVGARRALGAGPVFWQPCDDDGNVAVAGLHEGTAADAGVSG